MRLPGKPIMFQGTGSDVGKSIMTCAFCRIFVQDGYSVAPFKAQNMALNSFVTHEGGEIGRAQAAQAQAAKVLPTVDMNPVLMKPCSDKKAQIIVLGKPLGNKSALGYDSYKKSLSPVVRSSFGRLQKSHDIVVIEGAGSPAEINLRKNDIVNMAMAKMAHSPVILVGDIDRGGVFAWLSGTLDLLTPSERKLVKGIIINRFRGDKALLGNAVEFLERRTGVKVLGIVPYIKDLKIAQEDSIPAKERRTGSKKGTVRIAVIGLPHISNFTDFDALENEPDVELMYARSPQELSGDYDAVILPGTKNTIMDLLWLRRSGFEEKLRGFARARVMIAGICGGYQMLGTSIHDPKAVESRKKAIPGLGLLPVSTELKKDKTLSQVSGRDLRTGLAVRGYEIHHGVTVWRGPVTPAFTVTEPRRCNDGAVSRGGLVWGTYIHGVFDSDAFRRSFINSLRKKKGLPPLETTVSYDQEREFDALARAVRKNVDMKAVYGILKAGVS